MSTTDFIRVRELSIDLKNYRTVPQPDEMHAIHAMASISPSRFWGLMESLIEDGYLPTENILVLKAKGRFTVKEGNRRIAALKIIHGIVEYTEIPNNIKKKIELISDDWKKQNERIPCAVYESSESALVDKIVDLTHGKGQKASREKWSSVARARHNRDLGDHSEPALDILEEFLEKSTIIPSSFREMWAGEYPLTVLDEFIKKYHKNLGFKDQASLSLVYPEFGKRDVLDKVIKDIGLGIVKFDSIRNDVKRFESNYGLEIVWESDEETNSTTDEKPPETKGIDPNQNNVARPSAPQKEASEDQEDGQQQARTTKDSEAPQEEAPKPSSSNKPRKTRASASYDTKTVRKLLRTLKPIGDRHKVEALRQEALRLELKKHPLAFCFVLRCLFEISARHYCEDHKSDPNAPKFQNSKGEDRVLVNILGDIKDHLTNNNKDKQRLRDLHGAITELNTSGRLLSVTSMNQLIHNPNFVISSDSVATCFVNIYPMLEAMNRDE
jgi:hypothetical protein